MNHDHPVITAGSGITEMEIMWVLMAVMFAWNLYMVYQHNKLKKTVIHHCGSQKCIKCEKKDIK
jgi:hypothetical protein